MAARAAILCASALLAAAAAQAALQDRDLNGDSVVDAFYDTELDITWLRNADVNGPMDWDTAVAWADGFSFAGYGDWRLPTTPQLDPSCDDQWGFVSDGYNCTGSEMGHLWYVEFGNVAVAPTSTNNTGDFQNLYWSEYWSGTRFATFSESAFFFSMVEGRQTGLTGGRLYAMAVRDGDVPAIPEPQTYVLMFAGLGALALALARRRRPR